MPRAGAPIVATLDLHTNITRAMVEIKAGSITALDAVPGGAGEQSFRVILPGGEQRSFLEDEDELILTARAVRAGYRSIGFGACRGIVQPARSQTIAA